MLDEVDTVCMEQHWADEMFLRADLGVLVEPHGIWWVFGNYALFEAAPHAEESPGHIRLLDVHAHNIGGVDSSAVFSQCTFNKPVKDEQEMLSSAELVGFADVH